MVTHIITDTGQRPLLKKLELKSLLDFPPHVPILKWNWIETCKNDGSMGRFDVYATYPDRVHFEVEPGYELRVGVKNAKTVSIRVPFVGLNKSQDSEDSAEFSKISLVFFPSCRGLPRVPDVCLR